MSKSFMKRTAVIAVGLTCAMSSYAQSVVQGSVKDASGEPLIGVTIQVKGEQGGTVTDIAGNFTRPNVMPGATPAFPYVGYSTKEVAVGHRPIINVSPSEHTKQLTGVLCAV